MNTPINDGGPAFPIVPPSPYQSNIQPEFGMSLRDVFAAQAIAAASVLEHKYPSGSEGQPTYTGIATRAYYLADAMLAARSDNQQTHDHSST